ncbi:hypothetical protein M9194_19835 [Vibrio sp. S4M6]|uniref:hypothetical protein n=1 Tax=Vibrio sinus TaxID=2946865 RepID=UPI00202A8A65|nr:hypothetical protein [Vibrio sinus]MCL9783680.1 hypothetical protein [Vibrio sinus]
MSNHDYSTIRSQKVADIIHLPAHLVIDWLKTQRGFMGEAIAKACYQELARRQ